MGVFTRPDSPFWWMWLEGAPPNRARVNTRIPIGTTDFQKQESRKLADQAYYAQMGDRARARFRLPIEREPRTFRAHRAWYAEHVSPQKRGTTRELSMLKQLGAILDSDALVDLDPQRVREWRTTRLKTVAASTVRREEAILKHLLTTAVPKYLERNVLAGMPRLRPAPTDTRILTRDEEDRLLAPLTGAARALVVLALDTLLRAGNAAALTRRQDHQAFLFSDTKVDPIKIPISRRLRTALDALPPGSGDRYFPQYAGQPPAIIRMFAAACAAADIPYGRKLGGVTFHSLRHTGASRMLEHGVDVKTVMRIGGWRNLRVLERYLHPTDAAAVKAVEAIALRPRRR